MTIFVCIRSLNHLGLNELVTSEQKMQWLIARALGTDLNTSVQLSMKSVGSPIIFEHWFQLFTS